MATLEISTPDFHGASYDVNFPTRNTEELSKYFLGLFGDLALSGFVLNDGALETGSEEEYIFDSIWNAQTELIKQQQQRFENIRLLLVSKEEALPQESELTDLLDSFIDQGVTAFTAWLIAKLAASSVGAIAGGIVIPLSVVAIQTLRETYLTGEKLMKSIIGFMDSLTGGGMPRTRENYDLRAQLIDQNERQLANYLNEMLQIEKGEQGEQGDPLTEQNGGLADINKTLMQIAQNDASILCPHTGRYIYRKSLTQGA